MSDERVTPGRQLKEKISGYTTRRDVSDFRTEHHQSGCYNDEREGNLPGCCQGGYSRRLLRWFEVSA